MTKPINFNSPTPPTQEQFNAYHSDPIDYGEDGDQLLGFQYTEEEAVAKFAEHWKAMSGEEPDFDMAASVTQANAGWTTQPDQYEPDDFSFCWVRSDSGKVKPRYDAWLLFV